MASSITFSGLGSGLDTRAIIDALLAVERVPIQQLQARKATAQQKIDLLGTFEGLVDALRDQAAALGARSTFLSFGVTSSDDNIADIRAGGSATAGAHTLVAQSLATVDRWVFNGVADPNADLGIVDGQGVSFNYDGTNYLVRFNANVSSLNEIASGINTATAGAVTATVVNSGTSSTPSWQLLLTGRDTGKSHRITNLVSTLPGLTINASPPNAGNVATSPNNLTVAIDAVALIDGLQVTRASNDFSDVIPGVSITLLQANPSTTVSFSVAADKDAIKGRIEGFVEAYNAVIEFARDQQSYSEATGAGGPLFGDSALRRIRDVLDDALFGSTASQIAADTSGYGTLRLLGIESEADGTLALDEAALDAKLDADLAAFTDFFVDSDGFDNGGAAIGSAGYYTDITTDTGFGDDLARALDSIVEAYGAGAGVYADGLFDARSEALRDEIEIYDDRIEERERRLEQFEVRLEARFAALESLLAQLNAQSEYLSQHLAPDTSSKKK